MDKRKVDILRAVVQSYINSPIPVGSRTISKEFDFGVSSATIRNEMADLEDLGYLDKPHTSAGRIPSEKAYRFLIEEYSNDLNNYDYLLSDQHIREYMLRNVTNLNDVFSNTAKLLADITKCTSYVVTLKKPDTKIKFIQLIRIDNFSIILLIVGDKGVVEKRILNLDESISDLNLQEICQKLNENLSGVDFQKVKEAKITLKGFMVNYADFISEVIKNVSEFNKKVSALDFYYDGISNILNFQEYFEANKLRDFMNFIENKESIINLVKSSNLDEDFEVLIGDDISNEFMKNNSIIRANFLPKNKRIGQIGIIGPIRMDYLKQISIVKKVRDNLTFTLDKLVR